MALFVGNCGLLARRLSAKSFDLTDLLEKDLATCTIETILLRITPLRLVQSLLKLLFNTR